MALYCCEKCFQNPWLIKLIEEESTQGGTCDFCYANTVSLIQPHLLTECFRNAISAFRCLEYGSTLSPVLTS